MLLNFLSFFYIFIFRGFDSSQRANRFITQITPSFEFSRYNLPKTNIIFNYLDFRRQLEAWLRRLRTPTTFPCPFFFFYEIYIFFHFWTSFKIFQPAKDIILPNLINPKKKHSLISVSLFKYQCQPLQKSFVTRFRYKRDTPPGMILVTSALVYKC